MNAKRIRAAALRAQYALEFWSEHLEGKQLQPSADAALILSKLASGEWVLCRGEPVTWVRRDDLQHAKSAPFLGRLEPTKREADFVPLHARIPEEP